MRTVKFFDSWHRLEPYLDDPAVTRARRIFQWWRGRDEDGPLIENGVSDDEKWVVSKLASGPPMYKLCVPHECVDLNPILLPPLLTVSKVDESQLYVVGIAPVGSVDGHVVLTNQHLESSAVLRLSIDESDDADVIFYDLIYPLMPFFGKSWEDRSQDLADVKVNWCDKVEFNNESMGYTKYVDQ